MRYVFEYVQNAPNRFYKSVHNVRFQIVVNAELYRVR